MDNDLSEVKLFYSSDNISFSELQPLEQDALSGRNFFSISVLACDLIEIDELINTGEVIIV